MAFTTFIDDLALVEVLLILGAVIFAYGGVMAWWNIRKNDAKGLRNVLRGMAIPLGALGVVFISLALWGEMTWPFLASDGMAGYNIFFFDPMLLFGLVLISYSISAFLNVRMQYSGMFALVAGGATLFYGWTGYTATPAFTKDPLDTLLLYVAFGGTGIMLFPATLVVDYYVAATEAMKAPFTSVPHAVMGGLRRFGARGAQPVVPGNVANTKAPVEDAKPVYHFPIWAQSLVLLFPVVAGLAAIAAFWYFGITLPGHLGAGAGAAP